MNTSQLTWHLFWLIEHHLKLWKHFHRKVLLFGKLVFSFYYGSVYHFLKSFYNKAFTTWFVIIISIPTFTTNSLLQTILFFISGWDKWISRYCLTVSTIWCIFSPWKWSSWTITTSAIFKASTSSNYLNSLCSFRSWCNV